MERQHIERVLEATGQNRTLSAKIVGVDGKTLWRKLGPATPAGPDGD